MAHLTYSLLLRNVKDVSEPKEMSLMLIVHHQTPSTHCPALTVKWLGKFKKKKKKLGINYINGIYVGGFFFSELIQENNSLHSVCLQ